MKVDEPTPSEEVVQQKTEKTTESAEESVDNTEKKLSKKDRAIELVHAGWAADKKRADIIKEMNEQLGLSAAGASTYYQNIKSGKWTKSESAE